MLCIAQVATMEENSDQEALKYYEEALKIASKKVPENSESSIDQLEVINAGLATDISKAEELSKEH